METQPVIYKITSPSGRIYIGQARNYNKRLSQYRRLDCKGQPRLYRSLVKHGIESHVFEIVEGCLFEDLNRRERYWQDFYEVISKKGLNCVLQEADEKPRVVSEETRKKRSDSMKGKIFSDEHLKNMSESRKGKKQSEEQKKKKSESMMGTNNHFYGKTHTEETRKIQSEKSKTKTYSLENFERFKIWVAENKKGKIPKNSKMVVNIETGIFYDTIKEAAEAHCINKITLADYLRGTYKNKTNLRLV